MRYLMLLLLCACSGDAKPVTTDDPGDDDDNGDDDDTDSGTPPTGNFFEPVAVGFEFQGGILSDGTLSGYRYPGDPEDTTMEYIPYVVLTFASEAYFGAADATAQLPESCYAVALVDPLPAPTVPSIPSFLFDPETSTPTSTPGLLTFSYEFPLSIDPINSTCFDESEGGKLDPALWGPGGTVDLLDAFNGAHFGMGFGPLTDYGLAAFGEETLTNPEYDDFVNATFSEYIAINDAGGQWAALDWNLGYLFQWNEVTHEVAVDADDLLTYIPLNGTIPTGFIRSNALWYQDFPLLDLSNLKDGAR